MRSRNLIIGLVLAAILVAGGIWLYNWVLGETEPASGPISAPTLALPTATEAMAEPTQAPPTEAIAPTETPLPENTQPGAQGDSTPEAPVADSPAAGLVVYQISQEESEVRFNIFEELRGSPKDVIGVSDQVAGEAAVDLADLSTAQLGVIQINARTLATDDDRRNQAIRNRILNTDQYEFITFTPSQISGLSGSAASGQAISFQIAGDLTIREVTQPAVFQATAVLESPGRITGSASTTISRSDYNLLIPDVPFVANVGDEIKLEIDFVLIAP